MWISNRGWTILSSTNSATYHLRNDKPSWSWLRCSSTRSTTGSWRRPPRDAKGCPTMTQLDTKQTTPGSSTEQISRHSAFDPRISTTDLYMHLLLATDGSATATCLSSATAYPATRPRRSSAGRCYVLCLLWWGSNCWSRPGRRRTSFLRRNAHSFLHTFPSKIWDCTNTCSPYALHACIALHNSHVHICLQFLM